MSLGGLGLSVSAALGSTATGGTESPKLVTNAKSIDFDATNDYVNIGRPSWKDFGATNPFSAAGWFKRTGDTGGDNYGGVIIGNGSFGGNRSGWAVYVGDDDDNLAFQIRDTDFATEALSLKAGAVTDDQWHHFVAVRESGSVAKLYMDGVLKATGDPESRDIDNPVLVTIGALDTAADNTPIINREFYGNVDEIGIWDSALTLAEVKAMYDNVSLDLTQNSVGYASSSNLAGWWRMGDNDTYPCIADQRKTFLSTKSVEFDGSNDYFRCEQHASIDDIWDGGATCSMWIYLNPSASPASNGGLVHKSGNGNQGWSIYLDSYTSSKYKFRFSQKWDNEDLIQEAHVVYPYRWNHIVVTYDSSDIANRAIFYLNNSAQTFNVISSSYDASDSTAYDSDSAVDLEVGRKTTGGTYQNFRISDLALWNAVLDSDDVTAIYNSGEPNDLTLAASYNTDRTSNLKGYWSFGDVVDTASVGSNFPSGLSDMVDEDTSSGGAQGGGWYLDKADMTYGSDVADVEMMDDGEWAAQGSNTVALTDGDLVFTNVDTDGGTASRGIASINLNATRFTSVPTSYRFNKITIRCKINSGSAKWGLHTQAYNAEFGSFSNTEFEDYVMLYRKDHGDANWICPTSTSAGQIITVDSFKIEPCDGNVMSAKTIAVTEQMAFAPNRHSGEMINMASGDIETDVPS